jgi:transaldolase
MLRDAPGKPRMVFTPPSIKIFCDSADAGSMVEMAKNPRISGFTTNPTLMRKAGVSDYRAFARSVLAQIPDRPISFEVLADDFSTMERQALEISGWGPLVYVKIPVTNTRREPSFPLIRALSHRGVRVNVTAVFTLEQVHRAAEALQGGEPSVVSLFAGRIADSGRFPGPHATAAAGICRSFDPRIELLWASPREVLNLIEAAQAGCDIVTATPDLLKRMESWGKDLGDFSLETVKMFHDDARAAGYTL